jgi:hypothetical protein
MKALSRGERVWVRESVISNILCLWHHDCHRVAGRGLAGVVGGDDVDFQRLAAGLASQRGVAVGDGGDVDGEP